MARSRSSSGGARVPTAPTRAAPGVSPFRVPSSPAPAKRRRTKTTGPASPFALPPPPTPREVLYPKGPTHAGLVEAAERILDVWRAGVIPDATLRLSRPQNIRLSWAPWSVVAAYTVHVDYHALWRAFLDVQGDDDLGRLLDPRTIARVRITYRGRKKPKGRKVWQQEWTMSEMGRWEVVLQRCIWQCQPHEDEDAPPDEDSPVGARYFKEEGEEFTQRTVVYIVRIWFAEALGGTKGVL